MGHDLSGRLLRCTKLQFTEEESARPPSPTPPNCCYEHKRDYTALFALRRRRATAAAPTRAAPKMESVRGSGTLAYSISGMLKDPRARSSDETVMLANGLFETIPSNTKVLVS